MCTYLTEIVPMSGSAKAGKGWFKLSESSVYFDHPVHALLGHSLNIDFRNPDLGPGARVAVELSKDGARNLALAILRTLDAAGDL